MGRPNKPLTISEANRLQLRSMVRSRSMPHWLVRRSQIVLLSGEGESNREVARRCGVSAPVVSHWRRRYQERGLAGLHDELRPGRPRTHDDEKVAELITLVVQRKPDHATQWSVRSGAAVTGISKSSVGRYFALFGLQPHRSKSFKLSTDPFFVEKVRDIVGLYLNPPDKALVAVRGRAEPGAGIGAYPTGAADGLGLCRRSNPRLLPPRHHHPVRGTRHPRGQSDYVVQTASSPSGISHVP